MNSPVTKRKTDFTTNDPHLKKHDQTALDYLKCQILTEVSQEINKCNISKCNKSSTPSKSHTQTIESEINFLRSEMQGKNALIKSLVTSHMLHENVHVPYKNVKTNPPISPSKIIGAAEFCSPDQVSNSDDVIDFHINYEQIPTNDAKSKHDVPSGTNTFSVTDET